jgi:hypothetical protein
MNIIATSREISTSSVTGLQDGSAVFDPRQVQQLWIYSTLSFLSTGN